MQTAISGAQADIVLRYCLARIERLDALAAQYLPQAVEVYLFNRRIYDLAWEDIIPEELRTLSTQILQRITEGSRHV